jgi:proline-specific peptidase
MTKMLIRDFSMNVKIIGKGYPLVLMHGGPGGDLYTMMSFKSCSDQFTLIFYDHRCNGRSEGVDVSSLTWENLTADADALREKLGFEKWAVLGHSFGGNVALEYALRYPNSVSHLVLVDTGGDSRWPQENASLVLEKRGFSPEIVNLARCFLNGQIQPNEMMPDLMKLGKAYTYQVSLRQIPHLIQIGIMTKLRPEALIYGASHFLKNWTVMNRLNEIKIPTLIMAGREDFIFPPEHQEELAAGILNSRLVIIDRASHNVHDEQPVEVLRVLRDFLSAANAGST